MKTVKVKASGCYDVKIGRGLLDTLGTELSALASGSVLIVTDTNVAPLWLERAEASLKAAGFTVYSAVLPAGEASKSLENYGKLLRLLADKHLTRTDTVVAFGGGVMGDLAGFAAATYLRGLRFVQVPTTLLAMVDSSVGGKTAVDLPEGKNLAGAFHQPALVLCDIAALDTLPEETFREGCAEVIKTAILFDRPLFDRLAQDGLNFDREDVIARCVAHKRDIVAEDEFETGRRKLLNLGHTVGHAVEKCSGYTVTHGAAVAIGTAVMARAYCKQDREEILAVLKKFGLPLDTQFTPQELAQAALADKKRQGDTVTLVVPTAVGKCELCCLPVSELESVMEAGLTQWS